MPNTPDFTGSDSDVAKMSDQEKRRQRAAKRLRSPELVDEKFKLFEEKITKLFSSLKSDMDTKFENLDKRLSDIQGDLEKSLEFMTFKLDETRLKVDNLQKECKANQSRIVLLEDNIENLLRSTRVSSIEIRNVPHTTDETKEVLSNYIIQLGETVKAKISSTEIKDIFRLPGKPETNKPIIAELTSTMQKDKIIKAVKNYNAANRTSKLNASHLGLRGKSSPVFVAEHLTSKASRLHFLARELSKSGQYKYCWTSNGKVFLRKVDGAPPILVKSEEQITSLKQV